MNLDAGRRSTDSITWIDNNRDKINSFIGFYTEKLLYYVDKTPNITIPVPLTNEIQKIKDLKVTFALQLPIAALFYIT